MAEISKLSGVAIANVAKVDAVTKANIANINDLTVPSAAAFLLDTTYGSGAAAAYSVRRLATATTVLLRVRRETGGGTGDDDEADVAYDSNDELSLDSAISNASAGVTATTLGQFINVGTVGGTTYTNPDSLTVTASCHVDTWYDQAASLDATQATHTSQPQIHSGTVNTDLIKTNGKATIDFFANRLLLDGSGLNANSCCVFMVTQCDVTTGYGTALSFTSSQSSNRFVLMNKGAGDFYFLYDEDYTPAKTADTNQNLCALLASSTIGGAKGYINGTEEYSYTTLVTRTLVDPTTIGGFGTISGSYNGNFQEVLIWGSDKSTVRTDIEDDMNNHFSIYT